MNFPCCALFHIKIFRVCLKYFLNDWIPHHIHIYKCLNNQIIEFLQQFLFLIRTNLALNPKQGRLWTFERQGEHFDRYQKNCCKSCLLHPYHVKPGTTHLWTLTKIWTSFMWSKHCFWWCNYSAAISFCLNLKFFLCLKSDVFF